MNKHGKKGRRNYWIDIVLVDIFSAVTISILLFMNSLTYVPKPTIHWEVVKTQDKDYNRHILTDEQLSQLYTLKPEKRLTNTEILEFSYDDAQLLLAVGRTEGGPTLLGQLWAIRTIINRVQSDDFPNTVEEVIHQEGQFEVIDNGMWENADINSDTHIALAMIEGGWDETQGALYWEANSNTENSWHATHLEFIAEIEGNRYYK